jgi:Fe-S cluster assembly protein SufD
MSVAEGKPALERIERAHAAARAAWRGGAAWERRRGDALERFLGRGLPDRRDENWKYLDWPEIDRRAHAPQPGVTGEPALPAGALAGLAPVRTVVLVNGRFAPGLSAGPPVAGLEVEGLATALARDPETLERALRVPGDDADDRFALLAEAFVDDGVVIRLADGARPDGPLYVMHVGAGAGTSHTRVFIEAGSNSRLQLIEHFLSADDAAGLSNLACELRLANGAAVDHLRLYLQGHEAAHIETLHASQARDSRYRQQLFMLGGRIVRSSVHVRLEGPAAECELHGLFMVDGGRQADLYTVLEHVAPHTRSQELVRGVAADRGRGAFNGRILVGPLATKADSSQSSRNLILSPLAEINTRPQLEILTDDVKCSHGATTGSLDVNQLFYLLSRGIDPDTARGLLTFAFCEDVVARVAVPGLRRQMEELVVGRLPDRDIIREFV